MLLRMNAKRSTNAGKGKAIGIVRVSERGGREGESFVSPGAQRESIASWSEANGFGVLATHEEIDVSGGTPLAKREALRSAVEAIEAGEAEVVVVAYFDRLVRSLKVQHEVVDRVERAGGRVCAIDVGDVSHKTAAKWLSSTMIGMVSEYYRRSIGERVGEAHVAAVARGACPHAFVVGYQRGEDGRLVVDEREAPVVLEAFRMRAEDGATLRELRDHFAAHGISRTRSGIGTMIRSRLYLGEIHFGDLENLSAHEAIIPRDLFDAVQRTTGTRGRNSKSDHLLARQRVLRCAACDRPMVVGSGTGRPGKPATATYKCPGQKHDGDCPARAGITARIAEEVIEAAVRQVIATAEGRAAVEENATGVQAALANAQAALDSGIRTLAALADEPAAVETLAELRANRDEAQGHVDQLLANRPGVVVNGSEDWDSMTLAERRQLIRATIARATVARGGQGAGRVTVEFVGQ